MSDNLTDIATDTLTAERFLACVEYLENEHGATIPLTSTAVATCVRHLVDG